MAADPRSRTPPTWSDAFAALPDEMPPSGGWSRLEAAINPPPHSAYLSIYGVRRRRIALGMLAASMALAALIPWLVHEPDGVRRESSRVATRHEAPTPPVRRTGVQSTVLPRPVAAAANGDRNTAIAVQRDSTSQRSARTAAGMPRPSPASAPTQAREDADHGTSSAASAAPSTGPADAELAQLYLESARLEALLALTRDDRVQSATAAVLADELDSRIAFIDAALAEPHLPGSKRHALWRHRVATLREITGTQSTERWLAAHGTAARDSLVRID